MNILIIGILLILLLTAAWQDYRSYQISNILISLGVCAGILSNAFLPAGIGMLESLTGFGLGLALLLPFYLLRMMGAGDVKLMAMVGAFVGASNIWEVFISTLIAGGVLAFAVSFQRGVLGRLMKNLFHMLQKTFSLNKFNPVKNNLSAAEKTPSSSIGKLPYAIAITAGTAIFLTMNYSS